MIKRHSLLLRQLRKAFGSVDATPVEVTEFVKAVEEAYKDFDLDRQMLERSLEISSRELMEANASLRRSAEALMEAKEEQLRTVAARNDALGVLAGGIAHDFNNMLGIILGNLSLLRAKLRGAANLTELIKQAEVGVGLAVGLTRQLQTFASGGTPVTNTRSIEDLLRQATGFALRGSNVRADMTFAADLRDATIDASQITQVIQNVIINADQAMPAGGVINISAENVDVTEDDALPVAPGSYVRVSIRDSGGGIPADQIHRIFDPYFTTKKEGVGLGLATSYAIVARHGGLLTATSTLGKGSEFRIILPAAEKVQTRPPPPSPRPHAPPCVSRILVLDDDQLVSETVEQMLEFLGHEVTVVDDGRKAIGAYRTAHQSGRPFHLLIADLTVPGGMGGREVVACLKPDFPDLLAIASSGYSKHGLEQYERDGFAAILRKPYKLEDLSETVNRIVAESSPSCDSEQPDSEGP